jgi:hypothetical protein
MQCVVTTHLLACCCPLLRRPKHVFSRQPSSYHTAQGTSFSPVGHTDRLAARLQGSLNSRADTSRSVHTQAYTHAHIHAQTHHSRPAYS